MVGHSRKSDGVIGWIKWNRFIESSGVFLLHIRILLTRIKKKTMKERKKKQKLCDSEVPRCILVIFFPCKFMVYPIFLPTSLLLSRLGDFHQGEAVSPPDPSRVLCNAPGPL